MTNTTCCFLCTFTSNLVLLQTLVLYYLFLFRRTLWAARNNVILVRGFVERLPAFVLERQVRQLATACSMPLFVCHASPLTLLTALPLPPHSSTKNACCLQCLTLLRQEAECIRTFFETCAHVKNKPISDTVAPGVSLPPQRSNDSEGAYSRPGSAASAATPARDISVH